MINCVELFPIYEVSFTDFSRKDRQDAKKNKQITLRRRIFAPNKSYQLFTSF